MPLFMESEQRRGRFAGRGPLESVTESGSCACLDGALGQRRQHHGNRPGQVGRRSEM